MTAARLLWTPWPYRAGFCITDDTDAADLRSVRIVYDVLRSLNLRTTKTVWPFEPEEPCGIPATPASTLRGITLQDPDYLEYCRGLARDGFEIALHGASAGNNRRERIVQAFELLEREFGNSGTYICHSKNADNIYWEEKVAPNARLRIMLRLYSRHRAFGEVEGSPYFWGDICREKVRRIRLFRTLKTDTLAVNPSMPYYEESKPYVRGWFAATKRSFHDCTSAAALNRLARSNGLTVLYQYMHRYADPVRDEVLPEFWKDAERLAADERILVDTTQRLMDRLAAMHGIFIGWRDGSCTIFNTNETDVLDLQIELPSGVRLSRSHGGVEEHGSILRVRRIPARDTLRLGFNAPIRFSGRRTFEFDHAGHGSAGFGHGRFHANVGTEAWKVEGETLAPSRYRLVFNNGLDEIRPMSRAPHMELFRLFIGQVRIILRELASGKRSLRTETYLGEEERPMEDHANW